MKQRFWGTLLFLCLLFFSAGCGEKESQSNVSGESDIVAWGLAEDDFAVNGMVLGQTTAIQGETLLGDAVTATYQESDEVATGRMPPLQYIVEAGESCYYFGTFDPTLGRDQWPLFMVESTAAGTAGPRNIVVGDSLASVKERFPTDGAEGERLYRITVPVKKDREYDIIELYEADERKDEFFHSITFGCGYENSEWFAQYTVTFEEETVTGYTLYSF